MRTEIRRRRRTGRAWLLSSVFAAVGLVVAVAASAAVPQNSSPPTISGTAREGSTLTAADGTWANTPTSFTYQWQRCASDGTACGDISGAASKTYTLVTGDVAHTVRVVVTAVNADGKASASSAASDVVGSKNGPTNDVKPAVSGTATVGESLSVTNGSWTPTPTSFTRQWQRCGGDGTDCVNIDGATGQTYGVRSADVGNRLRALVTAHTASGQTSAVSNTSAVVTSTTVTTTQTTTTIVTTPAHKAPTLRFLSLRRIGMQVYARFRVCDESPGTIRITERDNKARALPYTRHLSVRIVSCGSFTRHWLLLPRYRTPGRVVVTLRAADRTGALSRLVSRSLLIR